MALFQRKNTARDGARARFEAEALPHLDALFAMALRLTRDERDAEDLVQDAMVRAYRFFDSFESGTNIKAWLFRILTNTFYNEIRKSKNIRRLESEAESGDHFERFISASSAQGRFAEDVLLDSLTNERIKEAIDSLPSEFATVVILCDIHGFSYKEIAEIADCPVGTVMSRLYRARKQLQKRLYVEALERGVIQANGAESSGGAETADLAAYRRRKGSA